MEIFICLNLFLLIIFEICLTVFLVKKIKNVQNQVIEFDKKLDLTGKEIILACQKTKKIVLKTGKIIKFFTNKKFAQIHKIIKITLDIIQLIFFVKSIEFRGMKTFNYKNFKKLFLSQVAKSYIFRFFKFVFR